MCALGCLDERKEEEEDEKEQDDFLFFQVCQPFFASLKSLGNAQTRNWGTK